VPPVSAARISLPDRYRIVRHLANGGMATVWEAHDELLGRPVAVKLLASHLSADDRARRRFQREARAAAGLSSHQHVVTIYDVGEHHGRVFMVMELMRGGTLGERLKAGRHFADDTALRWLREAAGALDAAHAAGVVHRDIKPANLLLDDHDRLAIADFGIARIAFEDQLTATGQVLGTAAYISPEQAMGEAATPASDRYALSIVAFELLTGSRPFESEHFAAQARAHVEDDPPLATEREPELPRSVDPVLDRAMAKEPGERWESAVAMVDALERALGSAPTGTAPTRPVAPPPPPPAEPVAAAGGKRPRRGPGAALLAAFAGLLLIAGLGFALISRDDDSPPAGGGQRASEQPREQRSESTPTAEPKPERTATATATPTAEATPEATPSPEPTSEPEPSGAPDLRQATALQVQGFNARRAGNYEQALALSRQALDACGDTRRLSPCGFALFEVGAALNGLGRHEEAIEALQQRLNIYGDNDAGEVQAELKKAQEAESGGGNGRGKGKGDD
jgi:serine/threonine protein kinase